MHYSKTTLIALAVLTLSGPAPAVFAGAETTPAAKDAAPPPPPPGPSVDMLINVEFASEYVTPRGMIVHNEGVTIEPLILGFANVYQSTGWLDSVKLVGGMWNDFSTDGVSKHAPYGSSPKTNYTEIDPIAGVSFGLAKYFTLDVTYTAFVEQIEDIGTSHHLETKLSFDDSAFMPSFLKGFGVHPYFSYWQELSGKATDADVPYAVFGPSPKSGDHPDPKSSYYFTVGIDPSYTFAQAYGLKLEAPCDILLPDSRFYGEYYGSANTVGLIELGVKATVPLKFAGSRFGHWSAHLGYVYMDFVDDNLYHLNTFNAPGHPTRTNNQVSGGISVFF